MFTYVYVCYVYAVIMYYVLPYVLHTLHTDVFPFVLTITNNTDIIHNIEDSPTIIFSSKRICMTRKICRRINMDNTAVSHHG